MGLSESKCKTNYPDICNVKCPAPKKCPAEKTCPEKKDNLNTVDGYLHGGRNIVNGLIPVKNVNQCRQIAQWNEGIGYHYRNENHPQYPNTCAIKAEMGSGELEAINEHQSGCVDTTKNVMDGCQ